MSAPVSTPADALVQLIRTQRRLWPRSTAYAHRRDMRGALDILEGAIQSRTAVVQV